MMKVKNFSNFQIYKDRSPKWICFHRALLDDPEWFALPKDVAWLLSMLWLLASEDPSREGNLPNIQKIAFRLRMQPEEVEAGIKQLNHWLVFDDTEPYSSVQNCIPYTYTDTYTDTDTEQKQRDISALASRGARKVTKSGYHECPGDWDPTPENVEALLKEGFSWEEISGAVRSMKDWSRGSGKRKKDWDATLRNWLRNGRKQSAPRKTRTQEAFEAIARGDRLILDPDEVTP